MRVSLRAAITKQRLRTNINPARHTTVLLRRSAPDITQEVEADRQTGQATGEDNPKNDSVQSTKLLSPLSPAPLKDASSVLPAAGGPSLLSLDNLTIQPRRLLQNRAPIGAKQFAAVYLLLPLPSSCLFAARCSFACSCWSLGLLHVQDARCQTNKDLTRTQHTDCDMPDCEFARAGGSGGI